MIFESRKLNPYAEPIQGSNLKLGSVYFFLNYADAEMLTPTLQPVVFIGRNLETGDSDQVYFQDIDSYRQGAQYKSARRDTEATFSSGSEKEISHVFEYEHALEELMRCSVRRNKRPERL